VNSLDEWATSASAELGLDRDLTDVDAVLDLARDVAHGVARPAAPIGAFVLGLAVGRGQRLDEAAQRLRELASHWRERA